MSIAQSTSVQTSVSQSSTLLQTMSAMAFGVVVLLAVGFAPMDAAHNAAHDTRHSLAFPCH
ncbi:CbtB domain-containing protein [Maricurvus nonylphenolicus]|uniref:CbtB domain-containing protein n=1 Tax=Maricurvus nonylphenolicus TaxID=1008307 RepID=UPI0036F32E59